MKQPKVQADWYDHPLYYDIIFDADTEKEVTFIEALCLKHGVYEGRRPLRILEPACGSGRLIKALAEKGHETYGFDLNERMLAFAQERLESEANLVKLWKDRMEDFTVPESKVFDVAHCLVSTFKYLLTEEDAVRHLQLVAQSLKPGGLYFLGFHLSNYQNGSAEHERWVGSRGGIEVVCNTHTYPPDSKTRREKLRSRLKITREGQSWIQETHWEFRTYSRAQVKALFAEVPEFECLECFPFSYDLSDSFPIHKAHYDTVFVLRKRP